MFWNITADNWALLWSAVIGAIIAGGSAAAVAMVVLSKTKKHQNELAMTQLDEQRVALERQITEQGTALARQLAEQKNQASLSRRIDAAADLASAIQDLPTKIEDGDAGISEVGQKAQAAAIRWRIESANEELGESLTKFVVRYVSKTMDLARTTPDDPRGFDKFGALIQIGTLFSDAMIRLSRSPDPENEAAALAVIRNLTSGFDHPPFEPLDAAGFSEQG